MESPEIQVTVIFPAATISELAEVITYEEGAAFVKEFRKTILEIDAIARAHSLCHRATGSGRCQRSHRPPHRLPNLASRQRTVSTPSFQALPPHCLEVLEFTLDVDTLRPQL
ncbi:hypothetical protein AAFN60_03225 [Roseibacillus persicicus]|uniref:hypothetical protein n=1 Tax=Roseibacillus persicicus TaxID=454148 RepID=UPI00398B0310